MAEPRGSAALERQVFEEPPAFDYLIQGPDDA